MIKANWALTAGSAVALLVGLAVERRIAPMPLLTGLFALVFAALAQRFHDTRFVKMQPTAINLFLGAVMLGGAAMRRNPLRAMLGSAIHLDPPAWRVLMIRYGALFMAEAALNEALWRTQPDADLVVAVAPARAAGAVAAVLLGPGAVPDETRPDGRGQPPNAEPDAEPYRNLCPPRRRWTRANRRPKAVRRPRTVWSIKLTH